MFPAYNIYDGTGDESWEEVEVVRPIEADMGMEVVCPPVVTPGEFFVCTADIPQGSDLSFSLTMVDDLDTNQITDSGNLSVPEQFLHIPGGPLKHMSWNLTLDPDDMSTSSFIIQSTYFQYMTNLSGIYYVPATSGDILFELVTPHCPMRKDQDGALVETYWCPISQSCEQYCFSFLESQEDK